MNYTLAILVLCFIPSLSYATACSDYRQRADEYYELALKNINQGSYYAEMTKRNPNSDAKIALGNSIAKAEKANELYVKNTQAFKVCVYLALKYGK